MVTFSSIITLEKQDTRESKDNNNNNCNFILTQDQEFKDFTIVRRRFQSC